jgi:hypothetical protein
MTNPGQKLNTLAAQIDALLFQADKAEWDGHDAKAYVLRAKAERLQSDFRHIHQGMR